MPGSVCGVLPSSSSCRARDCRLHRSKGRRGDQISWVLSLTLHLMCWVTLVWCASVSLRGKWGMGLFLGRSQGQEVL